MRITSSAIGVSAVLCLLLLVGVGRADGAFMPTDVSGLRFWFSGATLDASGPYSNGDPIGLWKTTGGDLNRDASATGSARPTYVDPAGGINGHSVARFDGATNWMSVQNTGFNTTDPSAGPSFFVVYRTTANDTTRGYGGNAPQNLLGDRTNQVLWGLGTDGGVAEYNAFNDTLPGQWARLNGTTPVNSGSAHLISAVRNGSTATLYSDWQLVASANVGTEFLGLTLFNTIGAGYLDGMGGVQDFFTGDIAEIIIYNRALTASETRDVNNYLLEEFAIPEPATAGVLAILPLLVARRRQRQINVNS